MNFPKVNYSVISSMLNIMLKRHNSYYAKKNTCMFVPVIFNNIVMAKLTIKDLQRKISYYAKWFVIIVSSNHGKKCAIGTILFKDRKQPFIITPRLYNHASNRFLVSIPADCVSVDIHTVTRQEYLLEYQNMVTFLTSCNPKQLEFVAKQWSELTKLSVDEVSDKIDELIWRYLHR